MSNMHKKHKHSHSHMGANSIDYYAYTSKMKHWNAGFKMLLGVGTLVLAVAADQLWILVWVFISMSALTLLVGKLSPHAYMRLLSIPLVFLVIGSLTIALEISRTPLSTWHLSIGGWYLMFTRHSLLLALLVMCKALAAVSALYMVTLSTSVNEILGVLGKLHVPALMIELMHLIYRYIFVLLDVAARMNYAAESRLGYGEVKKNFRTFGHLLGSLFIVSLKKANRYYDSMEARCYDGRLRFLQDDHPLTIWQILFGVLYLGTLIAAVIWTTYR